MAKILIVDDRPENLLTLEGLLEGHDVELVRANSGEEALAMTLDHDFALVLLDVQMPGMNGYEVAELMRGNKKTKHIPIIFVTAAYKDVQHIFKGYESGAIDYLFKPLDTAIFSNKVGVFIDLFQHKEALRTKTRELDRKLVELEELQQQLEEKNELLLHLSTTDGLTGLINRRYFDELLEDEWSRCTRTRHEFSLLILDIDHFKAYNDSYGHAVGDDCLKAVARTLMNVSRSMDKVARIGGEEFAIILPETCKIGASEFARRVREAVAEMAIPHESSNTAGHVTVSIGSSTTTPCNGSVPRVMLEAADQALYLAKNSGRNQCNCVMIELED